MNKNTQRRQTKLRRDRLSDKIAQMNDSKRINLREAKAAREQDAREARAAAEARKQALVMQP